MRGRAVGSVLLVALALLWGAAAALAQTRDVFTVANVHVDATAANAAAARDEARADGERKAYATLLDRLTLDQDHARLPPPDDTTLNDLIEGFEVANERTSGVRYLADYTYHFRADAVRQLLTQAQIPFCETPSKPVVVLPVLTGGAQPTLWEDPNPWRDAWDAQPPQAGLVPLLMPDGDLQDVQTIDGAAALSGDQAKLQAISQRYDDADVLTSAATLAADVAPHTVSVTTTHYLLAGGAPQTFSKTYTAQAGESDADLFADAVAGTADQIDEAWKQANMLDLSHSAVLVARVPTGSLDRFAALQDQLAHVPAVAGSTLLALDRDNATIEIHYYGSADQLRTALAQRDLTLSGEAPNWVIESSAVTPQP